jgi:hypothetical protein
MIIIIAGARAPGMLHRGYFVVRVSDAKPYQTQRDGVLDLVWSGLVIHCGKTKDGLSLTRSVQPKSNVDGWMAPSVRLTLCDRGSQSRWVVGVPDHARQPIDECPVSAIDCLVLRKVVGCERRWSGGLIPAGIGFYPLENETKPVWNMAGDGILFVRAQL